MRSGEAGAEGQETFETLAFDNLILLYTHSAFLQYPALMDRIVGRLKGKYYSSLPSVDDLKTFAAFVPPLYDYAIGVLAHEMVNPWTCNYTAYTGLANIDQGFSDALGAAIQKLITPRVKTGEEYYARTLNRQAAWSKEYLESFGKGVAPPKEDHVKQGTRKPSDKVSMKKPLSEKSKNTKPATASEGIKATTKVHLAGINMTAAHKAAICYSCNGADHFSRHCPAKTKQELVVPEPAGTAGNPNTCRDAKPKEPFPCYNCGEDGHMSRNCPAEKTEATKKAQGASVVCYNCNAEGHLSRDCTEEKKPVRPRPVCYNCNEEGHLSRDCTEAMKEDTRGPRDNSGRSRHFRQAQHDRAAYIEVASNGEGLRTCDREVKKGEKTRTGLVI
jgi:hypothetical protein